MPVERRGQVIALKSGQPATGGTRYSTGRRQPSRGGTSRMTRECQVRICERLGVQFPGPTRQFPGPTRQNENPPFLSLCQLPPVADIRQSDREQRERSRLRHTRSRKPRRRRRRDFKITYLKTASALR